MTEEDFGHLNYMQIGKTENLDMTAEVLIPVIK
jgi:hypothetical protein